jgi:hypothetical protein
MPLYDTRVGVNHLPVHQRYSRGPKIQPTGGFQGPFYQRFGEIRGASALGLACTSGRNAQALLRSQLRVIKFPHPGRRNFEPAS